MLKKYIGKYSQIITENGKCYDPSQIYDLSISEIEILSKRDFLKLFVDVDDKKKEAKKDGI